MLEAIAKSKAREVLAEERKSENYEN